MTRKSADGDSFIEVDPFDVFRVEGDIDRLNGQRFTEDKIRERKASQGIQSSRLIDDQKVDTDAQRLIRDAHYAQQQALKDLHAVGDESGLVIQREIIDSDGPQHQRVFSDSAGPEHQRIVSDADGPILSSFVRLAALAEPMTKAYFAQQNAFKDIQTITDMLYSSSTQRLDWLAGPVDPQKFSDASGPVLSSTSLPRNDPEDRKNLSLEKLLQRIQTVRTEQREALNYLHAMQDADGPRLDRAMTDVGSRLEQACHSQLEALGYLKRLEDVVGPLLNKHWSDSEREADAKGVSDASGPVRARNADDAIGPAIAIHMADAIGPATIEGAADSIGPQTPRHADDAEGPALPRGAIDAAGPLLPRAATDASGPLAPREATDATDASVPLTPREAIDAEGPNAPNSFDDAIGPTDRRLITDGKGPTLFHRIIEAVLPKKSVRVVTESAIEIEHHQSTIEERIAKVKADQRDAKQQLGELEKDNDKPLI
jgi:hypothetical protein